MQYLPQLISDEDDAVVSVLQELCRTEHCRALVGLQGEANLSLTSCLQAVPDSGPTCRAPQEGFPIVVDSFLCRGCRTQNVSWKRKLNLQDAQEMQDAL